MDHSIMINKDTVEDPVGRGCGVCDWDGHVTVATDYDHAYYTHCIITDDGEVFEGRQCSKRTRPRPDLLSQLREWL